jgi:hypothetical protein
MVVQLPLTDRLGTEAEGAVHGALVEALAEAFEADAFGQVDGSMVNDGKENVLIYDVPPDKWDAALAFVVAELGRRGLDGRALIARGTQASDQDDAEFEQEVVWPPDFKGKFSHF